MKKVYCGNCRHSKRGYICGTAIFNVTKGKVHTPGKIYEIPEEFDDCWKYKRKWWKVWVR